MATPHFIETIMCIWGCVGCVGVGCRVCGWCLHFCVFCLVLLRFVLCVCSFCSCFLFCFVYIGFFLFLFVCFFVFANLVTNIHFAVVGESHVCLLKKRPDPIRGNILRWFLLYDELCTCQAVVAPVSVKTCSNKDGNTCPDTSSCKLRFVDNPIRLTKRQNWNKETLDQLLERTDYCSKFIK